MHEVREALDRALAAIDAREDQPVAALECSSLAAWVIERWDAEVAHRPLENMHRRVLDNTWRQVYRHVTCGGELPRPDHDEARAAAVPDPQQPRGERTCGSCEYYRNKCPWPKTPCGHFTAREEG